MEAYNKVSRREELIELIPNGTAKDISIFLSEMIEQKERTLQTLSELVKEKVSFCDEK